MERRLALASARESASASSDGVVVLAFTRHPREAEDALLQSPPALSLKSRNVDISPLWANGAKILVEGIGRGDVEEARACFGGRVGLGPQHVVVNKRDEAAIREALRKLPWERRPTLRAAGGRVDIPDDGDSAWLDCSSWEGDRSVTVGEPFPATPRSETEGTGGLGEMLQLPEVPAYHITVRRTFIDIAFPKEYEPLRRSRSFHSI